jgi:hypothetical protein
MKRRTIFSARTVALRYAAEPLVERQILQSATVVDATAPGFAPFLDGQPRNPVRRESILVEITVRDTPRTYATIAVVSVLAGAASGLRTPG